MGRLNQMMWAWAGGTLGGVFLSRVTQSLSLGGEPAGFVIGAFGGILIGDAIFGGSVAKGVEGMILGTTRGLASVGGGLAGLWAGRNLPIESITVMPELTLAAIGSAVGLIAEWMIVPSFGDSDKE